MKVSSLQHYANLRLRNDLLPPLARMLDQFPMLPLLLLSLAKMVLRFFTIPSLLTSNVIYRSVSMVDLQFLPIGDHSDETIKAENGTNFWLRDVCPRYISFFWRD